MQRFKMGLTMACTAGLLALTTGAFGQVVWSDGFEDYAVGSGVLGQGQWWSWDGDAAWDSFVSDAYAHTGTKSLDVKGDSDTIGDLRDFNIADCGSWVLTCWQYVPSTSDMGANGNWFILQSDYNDNGPYDWRVQWRHEADGMVHNDFGDEQLPSIKDQWVEIRIEVDLDADYHRTIYGGDVLYEGSWTGSMNGGGTLNLDSIDLFAYAAESVFYDDFQLEFLGGCAPACATLDLSHSFAGLPVDFTVTGGEAGQQYGIFYAFRDNNFAGFNDCMANCGNNLGCAIGCLGSDFNNQVSIGRLNNSGEATVTANVPCAAGGRTIYFMVVTFDANGNICGSEVVPVTFVPC